MSNSPFYYLLSVPSLCVVLGGIIAASIYWDRYPRPALMTLLAMILFGASTILQPVIQTWVVSRPGVGNTAQLQQMQQMTLLISLVFGVIRAAVLGLLIAAAFVDRAPRFPSDEPGGRRVL